MQIEEIFAGQIPVHDGMPVRNLLRKYGIFFLNEMQGQL
jgi:hypothetical protein